uniref:Uncharacterized protein n=1 Tax=Avena sativa TaxID=4498 RepID=A0ACD5ZAN3_AVESA
MSSAACSPSSSSASPPPSCSATASGMSVCHGIRHPFPCFLFRITSGDLIGVDVIMVDALLRAAMDGDLDLVARMAAELKSGRVPGAGGVWLACGITALQLAAANGRAHVCRFLVRDLGIPVDSRSSSGDTPLLLAATFRHTATAACLLERGADPRALDSGGHAPLHWAAYNGDRELATLLLQRGADAGAASPRGTALQVAASRAHADVVAVLLLYGADPNKVADIVFTPLLSSIVAGSLECMKLLIEAGANVNAGGFNGTTPLFLACSRCGTLPFVKCLLEAGADPNVPDEVSTICVLYKHI